MKAVIMAGGEGSRLRPVTCENPKPMVKLLGKPVMEHIIALLRQNGIQDIAATLMYMPDRVTDYFGDGTDFGVRIEYFVEEAPLGTAGSVGACRNFLGRDDFLVISGDAVCDFDLKSLIAFHQQKRADVTIATYEASEPLEYGIVLSRDTGEVYGFVEKPGWDQVFSNQVNTGIYVISGEVLSKIPKGRSFDFSRDLFPLLLREKAGIYACKCAGYWCDMGDCEAYLNTALDMLAGRVGGLSKLDNYIGTGVKIGAGVVLDHAVLEDGAIVGDNAKISSSIVSGTIGAGAEINRAIVQPGALVGAGSRLGEGAVVGARAYVGRGCIVGDNVRIWPDKRLYDGMSAMSDITSNGSVKRGGMEEGSLLSSFEEPDVSFFLALGSAMASVFGGRIGVSYSDGRLADLFADCLISGARSCGSEVVAHDARIASVAAWAAKPLKMNACAHIEQSGSVIKTTVFDKNGLPLDRLSSRKLEALMHKGEINRATALMAGQKHRLSGIAEVYAQSVSGELSGMTLSVLGVDPASQLLRAVLTASGARLIEGRGSIMQFEPSSDGLALNITDEQGMRYTPAHTMNFVALCSFLEGRESIGVPYLAPAALDALAARFEARVLRVGRDNGADALYAQSPAFRDACAAAVLIASTMRKKALTLSEAAASMPSFALRYREVECTGDRAAIMRELADSLPGVSKELCQGLRVCMDGTWVHVAPMSARQALRISAEGTDMEAAEEMCIDFAERIRKRERTENKKYLH